ncbi:hypothetical protein EBZ80_26860 [bacterium]|nr:hypothetical protein [bacterium]
MSGNKITGGKPGPGRPKGSPNKVSTEAKNAIALAAANLGGHNRLVDWVKEDPKNESAFWTSIYPKLIAVSVVGPGDDGSHKLVVSWQG